MATRYAGLLLHFSCSDGLEGISFHGRHRRTPPCVGGRRQMDGRRFGGIGATGSQIQRSEDGCSKLTRQLGKHGFEWSRRSSQADDDHDVMARLFYIRGNISREGKSTPVRTKTRQGPERVFLAIRGLASRVHHARGVGRVFHRHAIGFTTCLCMDIYTACARRHINRVIYSTRGRHT